MAEDSFSHSSEDPGLTPLQRIRRENLLQQDGSLSIDQMLRQDESLWHILFDNSRDGILIINVNAEIVAVNKAFSQMIGYSAEELYRLTVLDMDVGISPDSVLRSLQRITTEGVHAETVYRRKDGSLIDVEMGNNAIYLGGEKLIYCVFRDISERKKYERQLQQLLSTDPLTGALNRREFTRLMQYELERAGRYQTPVALILFDVDHFKTINDCFGHMAGDRVLTSISALMKTRLRNTDSLVRWGGEEFLVMMPDTRLPQAESVATELQAAIEQLGIAEVGRVTASFGVTGMLAGDTQDAMIRRADQAMYRAKAAGRNCVRTQAQ